MTTSVPSGACTRRVCESWVVRSTRRPRPPCALPPKAPPARHAATMSHAAEYIAAHPIPSPDRPRPLSRAYHPTYDAATRRDALEFLREKVCELRPAYAALCIVY